MLGPTLRAVPIALAFTIATVATTQPAGAQNVDYGHAYDALDRTVVYVTTWFDDAKATSARRADGSIETIIEDAAARAVFISM